MSTSFGCIFYNLVARKMLKGSSSWRWSKQKQNWALLFCDIKGAVFKTKLWVLVCSIPQFCFYASCNFINFWHQIDSVSIRICFVSDFVELGIQDFKYSRQVLYQWAIPPTWIEVWAKVVQCLQLNIFRVPQVVKFVSFVWTSNWY